MGRYIVALDRDPTASVRAISANSDIVNSARRKCDAGAAHITPLVSTYTNTVTGSPPDYVTPVDIHYASDADPRFDPHGQSSRSNFAYSINHGMFCSLGERVTSPLRGRVLSACATFDREIVFPSSSVLCACRTRDSISFVIAPLSRHARIRSVNLFNRRKARGFFRPSSSPVNARTSICSTS